MVAAAVGPVTARPLLDRGVTPLVPDRGRLGALVRALVSHFEQAQSTAVLTSAGALQVRSTVALLDGHVLPLSPSGLDVLRLLADAGGDVVTREQVLAVLPGESADPHTAEVAVARLRDVCGRALIQTVVKRGYRLAVTALP
jgi:uroporphyrinogen-III synthase